MTDWEYLDFEIKMIQEMSGIPDISEEDALELFLNGVRDAGWKLDFKVNGKVHLKREKKEKKS